MTTATAKQEQIDIAWGSRRASASLHRTQRRMLKISVEPSGDIHVYAPAGEAIEAVKSRVERKGPWIFRQIDRIEAQPRTPARSFLSGETHLLLGRPYRLSVERSQNSAVRVDGERLIMRVPDPADASACKL